MIEAATQHLTPADAPAIGQYWQGQGGIYAGIMPDYVSTQPRFLIFATEEAVDLTWGGFGSSESGALHTDHGESNTKQLAECRRLGHDHEAAKYANEYEKDGHSDFYLPSKRELDVAYQTIRDQFNPMDLYWSSTEQSKIGAYGRNFGEGDIRKLFKNMKARVRPVRSMPANDDPAA